MAICTKSLFKRAPLNPLLWNDLTCMKFINENSPPFPSIAHIQILGKHQQQRWQEHYIKPASGSRG